MKNSTGTGQLVYDLIQYDVIYGKLKAGTKLKLGELKERYSVSVPTLREVLSRLTKEGYILFQEQKGFFVAPLSKENLAELVELRYLLESHMLGKSFENGTLDWESRVLASHHKLQVYENKIIENTATQEDLIQLKLTDYEYHRALISGHDSVEFTALHKVVFDKYLRYLINCLGFRGLVAIDEHKGLIECVMTKNRTQAKKILKKHIYECAGNFYK